MWQQITDAAKNYKKTTILAFIFTMIEILSETFIPMIMATMIDDGILAKNFDNIRKTGSIMIALSIIGLIAGVSAARLSAYSSTGFSSVIRFNLFSKIQDFSYSNIDKFSTGDLVTRMTTDVQNVQQAYQMSMRVGLRAPFKLIFGFVMALIINKKLSLIFVIVIIFLLVALSYIVYHAFKIFNQVFKQYGDLNQVIRENIRGIRVVKSFVREDYEESKFYRQAKKLYDLFVRAQKKTALNAPIMNLASSFAIIGISWLGAQSIVDGSLTPGELTSFLSYLSEILLGLMLLSMIFVMFMMALTSAKRIAEVQDEKIEIENPENPIYEVSDGSITFENVDFSFSKSSDNLALSNIDLQIKSGETIGLIGGTGSGKSALVNLIPRLYDVNSGNIKVGGVDVRKYDIKTLRDSVSVVLQKNTLFKGTIIENLRWGNQEATEEECIEACKIAQASSFIEELPDGYYSHVDQGGSNFSGGQKQRLCIARALVKNPKILIFDDSTSAVDTDTDRKIQTELKKSKPEVTKIIISQRISSIEKADRIIVIDNGKVDAFDTHENLLETNNLYKEIYDAQSEDVGDFDLASPDLEVAYE